jgi:tetrapyrrole methylase family protein/MazG family protein
LVSPSEQIIAGADLLRRVQEAPFAGPMLDLAPTRRTRVIGLSEREVASIMTLLERAYGPYENVNVRPDDDLNFVVEVAPLDSGENWRSAQRLHEIIAYLRSPEGCPWDRAQDWQSLAPKVVEEAYEVVDAIAAGDPAELAGELGDLLLIVALLTQIAEEQGAFTIEDVYETVNRKLIRRHPHVFGDDAADTPDAVISTWQRIKGEERGATAKPRSKYDRLPKSMPAMAKAAVMQDDAGVESAERELPKGDDLLAMIEAAIAAGRDPEAELQAALDRKYATN